MDPKALIAALDKSQEFFDRSTKALTEADSNFAPKEGMFTVAATVAHVAQTLDWFIDGAFHRKDGFSMDFEAMDAEVRAFTSLAAARKRLKACFDRSRAELARQTPASLMAPLPAGPIMGGLPRLVIVGAMEEHTAHHRGALSVYARLLGHVPPMPYMDMG